MRASLLALFLVGCAGAPSVESSQQATSNAPCAGGNCAAPRVSAPAGHELTPAPSLRGLPCTSASCLGLMQQRLDPVQLANDWGRPDLVDEIRVMTDEANSTLDFDERSMLVRAIYSQLAERAAQ